MCDLILLSVFLSQNKLNAINYFIIDMKDLLQLMETIFTFMIWTLFLLVYYRPGQT